jgi:hypothetical protein
MISTIIKEFGPWIVIFIMGWLMISQPEFIFPDRERTVTVTDTIHIPEPYEVIEWREREVEVPRTVTIFETVRDTIVDLRIETDTVFVSTQTGQQILYHPSFLTQFPQSPKFLGGFVSISKIELIGLFPNGETRSSSYSINLNKYNYNLGLTENGNFGVKRESIGWRENIRRSFYQEAFLGYDILNQYPSLQYRTGFNDIYNQLGIQGEIELSEQVQAKIGVNYRF